jgi:thiosulfate reductase cytochrome b subunit
VAAADQDPRPVTTGLFIQALNDLIDAYGKRQAALQKHIPEVVLLLLFAVFVIAGTIIGFASGLGGSRPHLATVAMTAMIVLVIFVVIDLDRPRRGIIQVSKASFVDLEASLADGRFGGPGSPPGR